MFDLLYKKKCFFCMGSKIHISKDDIMFDLMKIYSLHMSFYAGAYAHRSFPLKVLAEQEGECKNLVRIE